MTPTSHMRHGALALTLLAAMAMAPAHAQRLQQPLARSVVAAADAQGQAVLVSWRRLAQEPEGCRYNVYVRPEGGQYSKLNAQPLAATCYQSSLSALPFGSEVAVSMVDPAGEESALSRPFRLERQQWGNVFFDIDFETAVLRPDNYELKYAWPMDTDGDGDIDAILADRRYCGLAGEADPACSTTSHKLQAYALDGTCLWTIDMGPNVDICAGQNDLVTAYDIDCDGRCEVIIKSSDGTRFWNSAAGAWGAYVGGSATADTDGDGIVDYTQQAERNPPFYISIVDGATGQEKTYAELDYAAITDGTDQYGRDNRADYLDDSDGLEYAFLGGKFAICYFDGVHPSLAVQCYNRRRDSGHHYYVLEWRYDWASGQPSHWHHAYTWPMASANPPAAEFHQLRVADVDGDGIDELMEGGYAMNPSRGLVMSPGIGHGDRFDVGDIDPSRPGLEVYAIQQSNLLGQLLYDAATGEHIKEWHLSTIGDVGRGRCIDVDPAHKGYEIFSTMGNLYDCHGNVISEGTTAYPVEAAWWDGDLQRELIGSPGGSGRGTNVMITKYDGTRLTQFSRESSWSVHAGTAVRPAYMGDMTGDWREELILMKQNAQTSTGMVGYTTTLPTDYSLYTLQQDPNYRLDCTGRGYYQMPCTSFYLGGDMPYPPLPPCMVADVRWQDGGQWLEGGAGFTTFDQSSSVAYADGQSVVFDISGDCSQPIQLTGTLRPSAVYMMCPKGHDYTLEGTGTLAGSMELWKSMQGAATIHCDLQHTGPTIISEGTLCLNGTVQGPVELRARGTLAGTGTINGGMAFEEALNYEGCRIMPGCADSPTGAMTFGQSLVLPGGVYLEVNIADGRSSHIKVQGDLTIEGTNTITMNHSADTIAPGTYIVAECTGTLTADPSALATRGLDGVSHDITVSAHQLAIVVHETRHAQQDVRWTGQESAAWDYKSANFSHEGQGTTFVSGDEVVFGDDATVRTITVADNVAVGGMTFDFDGATYTLTGSGSIGGAGSLTKRGRGELRMELQANTYTGATIVGGGTLTITSLADGGTASSIGASTADEGNLQLTGGTLRVEATNMATDHVVTLADTSTICVASTSSTVSLKGRVQGDGYLIKDGPGQLNFTYGGENPFAGIIVRRGTIATGAWNSTFGRTGSPMLLEGGTVDLLDVNNSSTRPIFQYAATVPEGATATVKGTTRGAINGSFAGTGHLTIVSDGVRNDIGADFSQFAGTLTAQGANFRLMDNVTDMAQASIVMDEGCHMAHYQSNGSGARAVTTRMGSLEASSADCSLGNGRDSYEVGLNGASTTYRGSLRAATVTKRGAGTWTITNDESTASITVAEGTLRLNNSPLSATPSAITTGTITVADGGRLIGTGGASTITVANGGTIAAGSETTHGTLKATGDVTMQQGSTIEVRVGQSTSGSAVNDKYRFDGNVTHSGDTLLIIIDQGRTLAPGDEIEIFTIGGTHSGTYTIKTVSPGQTIEWNDYYLLSHGVLIVGTTSGIAEQTADSSTTDVHTLQGVRIRTAVPTESALDGLATGIYIVGGKVVVKN